MEGRPEITGWEALRRARSGVGTYLDAIEILEAEIAEHPRDGNRREWLATAMLNARRDEDCVAATDTGLEIDSARPRLHLIRSKALTHLGRHEDARASAERSVALDPESADGWTRLAAACHDCDDEEGAVSALDRADELGPQSAYSAYLRGLVHLKQRAWIEAERELRRAVQLDPANAHARGLFAQALLEQGRPRPALDAAEGALEVDPENALARTTAWDAATASMSVRQSRLGRWGVRRKRGAVFAAAALLATGAFWSAPVTLLAIVVGAVPFLLFSRVKYVRLPPRVRAVWNEQADAVAHGRSALPHATGGPNRWAWRARGVLILAYCYGAAFALGWALGYPLIGVASFTALFAVFAASALIVEIRRTPRAERAALRHARRAMAAHNRGDFDTQWVRAQRLVECAPDLPQVERIFVHALAHQDADAAMLPLDSLLVDPPADQKGRASLACAADEVGWALTRREEKTEALVWATRAAELLPKGRRAFYALCLAENGERAAAREQLDLSEPHERLVPPRLRAASLRWRAIAEALLGNAAAATDAVHEARELDPKSADLAYVDDRVRRMLERF